VSLGRHAVRALYTRDADGARYMNFKVKLIEVICLLGYSLTPWVPMLVRSDGNGVAAELMCRFYA
jgi:hypothetical protein